MAPLLLIIFFFIGICLFLPPYLFELPYSHDKVEAAVAGWVKGDFTYQKGSLTLFPRPCLHIRDAKLKTVNGVWATIDMVSAYPDLISLITGKFNIARVTIIRPNCIAALPEAETPSPAPVSLSSLQALLKAFVNGFVPAIQSKLTIDIRQGDLSLNRSGKTLLSIHEIDSRAEWKLPIVSVDIACRSDIWSGGTLAFTLNTATHTGKGRLALKKFAPEGIADALFPESFPRLTSALLDADIAWETRNFESWDLSFEALDPDLTFRKGKTIQIVRGKKAAGKLKIDKTSTHVSITDLELSSPRMQLTGSFDLETAPPLAAWQADARDADLASAKAATLFFVARSKTADEIFSILPEGDIPRISLGQKARDLEGFRDVTSLSIQGRMNQGTVHVPEPDLLLADTSGEVTVSNGILEARDVQTRLGNSTGSQGRFSMSLKKEKPRPLHVEADVHADLSELPPLLVRLIGEGLLPDEMRRVTSAQGSAVGKMVLDRESDPLHVTVDVSAFDLSATYDRIPFPLSISGGGFHLKNGTVAVQDIQGKIGDTLFTDLSGEISLNSSPVLTISKARADANVDEITSWLETNPTVGRIMESLQPAKGRISIDSLSFGGPVNTPGDWQFQSEGHVTDTFTLLIPLFPKALIFQQGRFTISRDELDFSSDDLSILDARLHAAGTLYDYLTKNRRLEAQLDGKLGEGSCDWVHGEATIPKMCRWRAPITLPALTLQWQESEGLSASGEGTVENGPHVIFDITRTPDTLVIKNLTIQDRGAQASVSLTLDKDLLAAEFSGTLSSSSLNALLLENHLLTGSVQGDFKARYSFDHPFKSTLKGNLQVAGLDMSPFGLPLKIVDVSLTADGTSSRISTGRFVWKESEFLTSGRISQAENGVMLDLGLDSERLDWSEIKAFLDQPQSKKYSRPDFLFGNVRATCDHFALSPSMVFQPLKVEFQLNGDRTDIIFHQADACGISFPGTITVTPEKILFSFEPTATKQALEPTLACLQNGKKFMDGLYDLEGTIAFRLNGASITESLEGEASLRAENGRIYRAVLLGKIFSLLNIGEILSGDFPNLEKEGFPYKAATFKGKFKQGRFELETGVIDSSGMKIFYEGSEDLVKKRHDLTVIVAPLKTIDSVIEKIPLVNNILDKGAVIYPVRVSGPWDKPELSLLSPTAVGSEVWGIMLRTLKLPVTLLESIFSGNKKE